MQNWPTQILDYNTSFTTLCLAKHFYWRLRRFILHLEDAQLQRIAASIQISPSRLPHLLRAQQVRRLLLAGCLAFSLDKAERTVQRESEHRARCLTCSEYMMSPTTAALIADHGSDAITQLHKRIDENVDIMDLRMVADHEDLEAAPDDAVAVLPEQVRDLLHWIADSTSYAELDKAMDGHQEEQQLQWQQGVDLIFLLRIRLLSDLHRQCACSEKWLRNLMHKIVVIAPSIEVSNAANSLLQLQTTHGNPRFVSLSEQQVRRCLQGIAYTVRFDKVMATLQRATADGKCQSQVLWEQMIRELKFAIFVTNDFNRFKTVHGHCRSAEKRKVLEQPDAAKVFALLVQRSGTGLSDINVGNDRERFLECAALRRPEALRLIDVEATSREGMVCLAEYGPNTTGFSAVSHTFGADVYEIFNCQCTTTWISAFAVAGNAIGGDHEGREKPRCRIGPCPHDSRVSPAMKRTRDRVVSDILRMCEILKAAGVRYAWHDGVCIAQHDDEEVTATIERIGWVYAYAGETIIFLHYVGKPMGLLNPGDLMMNWDLDSLRARWHRRAWTFQEAALSVKRRYCVRVALNSSTSLGECQSLQDFAMKIEEWYNDDTSTIQVVEESTFLDMVREALVTLQPVYHRFSEALEADYLRRDLDDSDRVLLYPKMCADTTADEWVKNLSQLFTSLLATSISFPTAMKALEETSKRDCKHVGDRINSILALSGVTGFVAPKDSDMERSTVEFFRRQNQRGLQTALYAMNNKAEIKPEDVVYHKRWMPSLESPIHMPRLFLARSNLIPLSSLKCNVLLDHGKKLEVVGEVVCVKANFRVSNHRNISDAASAADSAGNHREQDVLKAHAAARLVHHINAFIAEGTSFSDLESSEDYSRLFKDYVTALEQHVIRSMSSSSTGANSGGLLKDTYMEILGQSLRDPNAVHRLALSDYTGTTEAVHGEGVLERMRCDQEERGMCVELRPAIENEFEAVWPGGDRDHSCSFGTAAICPYNIIADEGMDGRFFSAYLMMPLDCHTELREWPILMLQCSSTSMEDEEEEGDIRRHHHKVGVLEPSKLFRACFHHFVHTHPHQTTRLSNLIFR